MQVAEKKARDEARKRQERLADEAEERRAQQVRGLGRVPAQYAQSLALAAEGRHQPGQGHPSECMAPHVQS